MYKWGNTTPVGIKCTNGINSLLNVRYKMYKWGNTTPY